MSYKCLVDGCRNPNSHVTLGHECGNKHCTHPSRFGHGYHECINDTTMNILITNSNYNIVLPQNERCTCKYCRFSQYHRTDGHQCEPCQQYGHGDHEHHHPCGLCNSPNKPTQYHLIGNCPLRLKLQNNNDNTYGTFTLPIRNYMNMETRITCINFKCPSCRVELKSTENKKLPTDFEIQCCICTDKKTNPILFACNHGACPDCCGDLLNASANDPRNISEIVYISLVPQNYTESSVVPGFFIDPKQANNIIDTFKDRTNDHIFIIFDAGMGCIYYMKRAQMNSTELHGFFMHSDCWGQYGEASDDRPKLAQFLFGYEEKPKILTGW